MFLDRVTVTSLPQMLPHALGHRLRRRAPLYFRYFSASTGGKRMLGLFQRLGWMKGEEAAYSYEDVLDDSGGLVIMRALEMDSLPICEAARSGLFEASPALARFARWFDRERLHLYLQKALNEEIQTTLVHVNVVSWFHRQVDRSDAEKGLLLVPRSLWLRHLQGYAATCGVELRGYRTLLKPQAFPWFKVLGVAWSSAWRLLKSVGARRARAPAGPRSQTGQKGGGVEPPFTVAAPYWGQGVTLDLSKNSDLFWFPFSSIAPDRLLVYASRSDDPLDESKYATLRRSSIRATAIKKAAKAGPNVPTWPRQVHLPGLVAELRRLWKLLVPSLAGALLARGVDRWVGQNLLKFAFSYVYWRWFFTSYNVKVQVDHTDGPRYRLASDQAIADLGGLSISSQRSYEAFPSVARASAVDVHFAFSTAWFETERRSRSMIPQYISNGYVHDYAFARVGGRAAQLRSRLADRGARFVICLLDGNSVADKRAGPSHSRRAENYRFLLEKLLDDPTLGLVIKPKKPVDLRQRLGPVAELLDAALATGRCHMYQGGIISTETLPCEASRAADITIGLLFGSTAALESVLAGTPTLMIDREFLTYHPLYALGEGRVVFREWEQLWEALTAYRQDPASVPGLGDWSPLLKTLDSFQDGKAAQRMGEYIGWLADGLAKGMTRNEAMESARRRYAALWGSDKIVDLRNGAIETPQKAGELQVTR